MNILYEDNHIICVEKQSGILSQGDIRDEPTLYDNIKQYIKIKYNKTGNVFLGVVHRIDMQVSGAIVYARTSKAAARLHASMVAGKFRKFYIAIVPAANFPAGRQIMEDKLQKIYGGAAITGEETAGAKTAKLECSLLAKNEKFMILLIALHTGRKHQIRVQLASRGMPIVGDAKYGSALRLNAIMLHGLYLSFPHPVQNKNIEVISPIPERFYTYFEKNEIFLQKMIDQIRDYLS